MPGYVLMVLACSAAFPSDNPDATQAELARLQGVWSFVSVEVDGAKQPDVPFATHKLIISRDGSFVVVQGPRITRGTLKLDVTKSPKHLDVTVPGGPGGGRSMACIYELEADTYRLCASFRGGERPAAFTSTPDSGLILQVLKREKQGVKDALIEVGRKELAGTWQAVSYALDGKPASDEDMRKVTLTIDVDGRAMARSEGKVFLDVTTTVDPTAHPMTIELTFLEGDAKGKTARGIYKIDGDLLSLCRAGPGAARPTEFVSNPGSGHALMTYRRLPATK